MCADQMCSFANGVQICNSKLDGNGFENFKKDNDSYARYTLEYNRKARCCLVCFKYEV